MFRERGVRLDRTYQLNFGGNTDFLNMLERDRLESKKISKTQAVTSQLGHALPARDVHVGPSDYVPWLTDRKWCYIRMEGTTFGNVPINCEMKLEVWDSPNSAGVVIDAVRCAKLALDRKISGALVAPSSYFMKSPPQQFTDDEARQKTDEFIRGDEDLVMPDPVKRNGNGHRKVEGAKWAQSSGNEVARLGFADHVARLFVVAHRDEAWRDGACPHPSIPRTRPGRPASASPSGTLSSSRRSAPRPSARLSSPAD